MADLLTEADPMVMGLTYFSVLTMAHGITTGYFNPILSGGAYIFRHGDIEDALYNLVSQVAGGLTAVFFFDPIKVYIS